MSGFPTVNFSDTDEGLFSPSEILHLMGVEFERAQRYGYQAALVILAVDRLEYLHDLYGWESKEEILQGVINVLRTTTRDSDFLGCMQDDRIMAVFPHASDDTITAIATRLLRICRDLDFQSDGRSLRATVSIGISFLKKGGDQDFGSFLSTAEEALEFAIRSGGDRYVRRESATEVIETLRNEIEEEARSLVEEHERTRVVRPSLFEDMPETELGDRLRALFRKHSRSHGTPGMLGLEEDVVRIAEQALHYEREEALTKATSDHEEQVDLLERRVAKMKDLLDATEGELFALAKLKGVDSGVASIYRTVQGLREDDTAHGQKKEMLTLIFEANLELQKKKRGS